MLKKKLKSILTSYGSHCILYDKEKKYDFLCVIQPIKTNSQTTIMDHFSNIGILNKGFYRYFCAVDDISNLLCVGSIIAFKTQAFIVKKIDVYTLGNQDIYQMGILESAYFDKKEG